MAESLNLESLNPAQRQCVETLSGPIMLLAGAGTGKTRVITYRIANLLKNGVDPKSIVALTFTNKAAREMKERVTALAPTQAKELTVSTFHSFCLSLLRKNPEASGLGKRFSILSAGDQLDLVKRSVAERAAAGQWRAESVQAAISHCKNQLWSSDDIAQFGNIDQLQGVDPLALAEIFAVYERQLRLHQSIDFDDCIYRTHILLSNHVGIRAGITGQLVHMLVDEFQDTNFSQLAIVQSLCEERRNICVVGDDDQSIYSWRGAMAEVLIKFEEIFPERSLIKLEQNYRCTNIILNAANAVIKNNRNRKAKVLWSESQLTHPIILAKKKNEIEEARWIAQRSLSLLGKGYKPSDIAVLYRANALCKNIEIALREVNIHYKVYGGQSLFERKEVKDVLAYLRLIADHDHRIAFLRVVNIPSRGIGLKTLERLEEIASTHGGSLFANLSRLDLTGKTLSQITLFSDLVTKLHHHKPTNKDTFKDYVKEVIASFRLETEARSSASTSEIGDRRVEFLKRLPEWLANFAERIFPDWEGFDLLELIDQLTLNESDSKDERNLENSVSLMTVHAAKGLEFRCVFVCGVEDGIFPHRNSVESPKGVDEERRLFYVALTRAKHHLHLSYCKERQNLGGSMSAKASRFIEEMPKEGLSLESDVDADIPVEQKRERTRERLSKLRQSLQP